MLRKREKIQKDQAHQIFVYLLILGLTRMKLVEILRHNYLLHHSKEPIICLYCNSLLTVSLSLSRSLSNISSLSK